MLHLQEVCRMHLLQYLDCKWSNLVIEGHKHSKCCLNLIHVKHARFVQQTFGLLFFAWSSLSSYKVGWDWVWPQVHWTWGGATSRTKVKMMHRCWWQWLNWSISREKRNCCVIDSFFQGRRQPGVQRVGLWGENRELRVPRRKRGTI